MTTTTVIEFVLSKMKEDGEVEVFDGIYICRASRMIEQQEEWEEEDEMKTFDFTTADYWILTTGTPTVKPFDYLSDALAFCVTNF